jgi:hypothetical protein
MAAAGLSDTEELLENDSDSSWSDDDLFMGLVWDERPSRPHNVANLQPDLSEEVAANDQSTAADDDSDEDDNASGTEDDSRPGRPTSMHTDASDEDLYDSDELRTTLAMIDEELAPNFNWQPTGITMVSPAFTPKRTVGPHHDIPASAEASSYLELFYTDDILQKVLLYFDLKKQRCHYIG